MQAPGCVRRAVGWSGGARTERDRRLCPLDGRQGSNMQACREAVGARLPPGCQARRDPSGAGLRPTLACSDPQAAAFLGTRHGVYDSGGPSISEPRPVAGPGFASEGARHEEHPEPGRHSIAHGTAQGRKRSCPGLWPPGMRSHRAGPGVEEERADAAKDLEGKRPARRAEEEDNRQDLQRLRLGQAL